VDPDTDDPWLTAEEVADRLRQTVATVKYWRKRGTGPEGTRLGKHVRYRLSAVRDWETMREQAERQARTAS
jgi:predicted DNA-binding transcriptional regulator AlpA